MNNKTTKTQLVWKHERPQIAKAVLRKKTAGRIRLTAFRLYYKATVIKIVWFLHKNRNIDQQIRIDSLLISACTYDHVIYDKGAKNIKWEKKTAFSISGAKKTRQLHVKEWN